MNDAFAGRACRATLSYGQNTRVRHVTLLRLPEAYQAMVATAKEWKFIPAFSYGYSVASYFTYTLSLKR